MDHTAIGAMSYFTDEKLHKSDCVTSEVSQEPYPSRVGIAHSRNGERDICQDMTREWPDWTRTGRRGHGPSTRPGVLLNTEPRLGNAYPNMAFDGETYQIFYGNCISSPGVAPVRVLAFEFASVWCLHLVGVGNGVRVRVTSSPVMEFAFAFV